MLAFLATPIGRWVGSIASGALLLFAVYLGFRWWLHEHDQTLLKGYVLESEKAASDALVKKFQHDLLLGQQIREQADKAAENLDMENQKTEAANEKAIAANPGGSVVTADDVARIKRVLDAQ
ncbi:hypothetical protein HJB79_31435 [Rhizobium lentis]|uniref:hypothetical protein n=1 Tax=Rhizobium lentis TaxID=1138194 RepID=UPI001C83B8C9|nr:hypothetical protein [Rhizobium lentis]MBX5143223.1 hypothetical protein [Rhizobium lentis]